MSSRKGYSIYRRQGKGPFYVTWTDGTGKRCTRKAGRDRNVANEIGRAMARQADRIRGGAVTAPEAKAIEAGRLLIGEHIKAWAKVLKDKGDTPKHIQVSESRVTRICEIATAYSLAEITGERIQAALARIKTPNTARHYLTALRGFIYWCMETDRLTADPVKAVKMPNVAGKTFTRTAIDADALGRLLAATRKRDERWAFFYEVMAHTGFRLSEALSLTHDSFTFGVEPVVTVEAAYAKNRRKDSIPIGKDLADRLMAWLPTQREGRRTFWFPIWTRFGKVFRADCKAAGIVPAKGERLGVHSLRRFFITSVVRAGGLVVGQDLARHSTPALTKGYSDMEMADYRKAIEGLPKGEVTQGRKRA